MVESVNAASRVGALVLSLIVFAAAWESDSHPTSVEHRLVLRTVGPTAIAQNDAVIQTRHDATDINAFETLLPTSFQTVQFPVAGIPRNLSATNNLPAGIAPGRYRVVDSDGTIDSIVVSHPATGSGQLTPTPSLYTLQLGSRTRYFIRIESPEAEIATTEIRTLR